MDQDQERYASPASTSPVAYLQISAILRLNIRMKERKKRESPDLYGFKYEMTNIITQGTKLI